MVATRSNKRQRQSSTTVTITDFPDTVLSSISSYLTQTSCLQFCLAMSSSLQQPDSSISKAIMTQHNLWDSIDVNDMKELFGGNITDDNIRWLLKCTDAVHNLKTLKITNCLGVVGRGLQPLVGSTTLESIDLSLVGANKSPIIDPVPPISAEVVVPILESIISAEGNALKHVTLPKKWRVEKSDILTTFLRKFESVLDSRGIKCFAHKCEEICEGREGNSLVCSDSEQNRYGITTSACSECKQSFCNACQDRYEFVFCKVCEKIYCDICGQFSFCSKNNNSISLHASWHPSF